MNIVGFGGGAFGIPAFASLARAHRLVAIVTPPDRPAGRGRELTPSPVAGWAAEHVPDVALLKPENVNEPGVVARVRGLEADAWVVIAFGQKLSPVLLDGVFAINLHASLLPRWRGAAPINAAILAGDGATGLSVITLADKMDAGAILAQSRCAIRPEDTAGDLHDRLAQGGPALIEQVLREKQQGTLTPRAQDEALVTFAPKLSARDRWVDFSQSAEMCRRRIHGVTPWPGVSINLAGRPCKVLRAALASSSQASTPGTLIDAASGIIACGGGTALRLIEVQPPGRRAMSWTDYARGRRLKDGE